MKNNTYFWFPELSVSNKDFAFFNASPIGVPPSGSSLSERNFLIDATFLSVSSLVKLIAFVVLVFSPCVPLKYTTATWLSGDASFKVSMKVSAAFTSAVIPFVPIDSDLSSTNTTLAASASVPASRPDVLAPRVISYSRLL